MCKEDAVQAPSWVCHHDDRLWPGVPANMFHVDWYLAFDAATQKTVFSTAGSAGKLFPFGGGKSICPGRNFAKQEVLGAVATILDQFRFEPLNFISLDGRTTSNFPTVKEGYAGNGMVLPRGDLTVQVFRCQ
ncbi:uncharacterized protein SETTUDRAFT_30505 [Exserohilum turcica Et28A]|uniref:Uncharacterized protein n=1 Tax=Exserohilum turcicum (strain 28A) TaxID=671987 RepID=R0KGM8_EXST2|nr:uncharacterized protein SETTUDRAFT_30505 [Exserohilum turcica Et28A]EOA92018.1 hypothetical protein SETTUDRAFT_30505 [Exserohilum turcica Et28A]